MNPVFRFFYDKDEFSLLRVMVAVSLITHVLAVVVLSRYGLAKPGRRIVTIKMVQAQREAGVKKAAQSEGKKVAEAAPAPKASAEPAPAPAAPSPAAQAARTEAIRKSVSKKGLLNVLGKADFTTGSKSAANFGTALSKAGSGTAGSGTGATGPAGFGYSMGSGSATGDTWAGKGVDTKDFAAQSASEVAKAAPKVTKIEKSADTKVVSQETAKTAEELTNREVLEEIKRNVERYTGGLRYSYNKQLRKNPDLQGRVTVAITVNPSGAVEEAKIVESTMNSPEMEQEILAKIKHWSFPAILRKTTTVTYPFVFLPPT